MTVLPFTRPLEVDGAAPVTDDLSGGDVDWRVFAECSRTDPEAFFDDDAGTRAVAKRVCAGCPVRLLCLSEALQLAAGGERVWGVWGGMDERDRRRLSRGQQRSIIAEAAWFLTDAA